MGLPSPLPAQTMPLDLSPGSSPDRAAGSRDQQGLQSSTNITVLGKTSAKSGHVLHSRS